MGESSIGAEESGGYHGEITAPAAALFFAPNILCHLPPYDGDNFPMSRLFTITNMPAFSLVYRFGEKKASAPASKPR
jgi:hypothetical protein